MNKYIALFFAVAGILIFSCKKPGTAPLKVNPKASFSDSINGYAVSFNSTSTTTTSLKWNFGDGSKTDTGKTILHFYKAPGNYHVVLTAMNSDGSDTLGMNISIIDTATLEKVVNIHTRFGSMFLWLYDEMPIYKANYLKNVTTHLYDSTAFHRCVPNFVIQGGDSLSKGADQSQAGTGGSDNLPFKVVAGITHIYGAVGAASLGAGKPGNNWQFYIVTNTSGDHSLDGSYAVFGYIMKGMDVAITIQNQPQNTANNMPFTPIRMSCSILYESKAQILANYGYTVK